MKLLTLNGVEFPLTQLDSEPVRAGDVERSANLLARDGVRASAWDLKCAVSLLDQPLARAVRGLVSGAGEVFSFDSTGPGTAYQWGSRGSVAYDNDGDAHRVSGAGAPRSSPGALWVDSGASLTYRFPRTTEWTVLDWCSPNFDDYYIQVIRTSDGRTYEDGVLLPASGTYVGEAFSVTTDSGGTYLTLLDSNGETLTHDDVVFLPWLLPAEWVPAVHAFHLANLWPALPNVLAEGAAVEGGSSLVVGRVGGLTRTVGATPGTWRESFGFDLLANP